MNYKKFKKRIQDGKDKQRLLKANNISSAEYQLVKGLKAFSKDDWKWDKEEGLYKKIEKVKDSKDSYYNGADSIGKGTTVKVFKHGEYEELEDDGEYTIKRVFKDGTETDMVELEEVEGEFELNTFEGIDDPLEGDVIYTDPSEHMMVYIQENIGNDPGYYFFAEDEDVEEFNNLFDAWDYEAAISKLTNTHDLDIVDYASLVKFIQEN